MFNGATPHWLILIILFASGFCRSLQFTALNTLAFADMTADKMSKASVLQSVGQQVAQSMGTSVAALLVQIVHDLCRRVGLEPGRDCARLRGDFRAGLDRPVLLVRDAEERRRFNSRAARAAVD